VKPLPPPFARDRHSFGAYRSGAVQETLVVGGAVVSGEGRTGSTTGATIGRYGVTRLIGAGRLARVFECSSPRDGAVAVKLVRARHARLGEEAFRAGRDLLRVRSAHVVRVLDIGVHNASPYVVMELLTQPDLGERLRAGPLRTVDALHVLRDVLFGLAATQAHGLVHGNLHPRNVFLDETGRARIADLLMAPPIEGTQARGTPSFTAPEVLAGGFATEAADLYSLGAVLYALVAGRAPFAGAASEQVSQALFSDPPSLATIGAPARLVELCEALMARDVSMRPRGTSEALALIDALLGTPSAPPADAGDDLDVFDDVSVSSFEGERTEETGLRAKPRPRPTAEEFSGNEVNDEDGATQVRPLGPLSAEDIGLELLPLSPILPPRR
jgi:serine/threonine protein kinase